MVAMATMYQLINICLSYCCHHSSAQTMVTMATVYQLIKICWSYCCCHRPEQAMVAVPAPCIT